MDNNNINIEKRKELFDELYRTRYKDTGTMAYEYIYIKHRNDGLYSDFKDFLGLIGMAAIYFNVCDRISLEKPKNVVYVDDIDWYVVHKEITSEDGKLRGSTQAYTTYKEASAQFFFEIESYIHTAKEINVKYTDNEDMPLLATFLTKNKTKGKFFVERIKTK